MQTLIFALLGLVSIVVGFIISLVLPEIKVIAYVLIGFGLILVGSAAGHRFPPCERRSKQPAR